MPQPRPLLVALAALFSSVVLLGAIGWGSVAHAQISPSTTAATTAPAVVPNAQPTKDAARDELTPPKAVGLGVIEGVTEFLPISSSGHLLVAQKLMGVGTTDVTKEAADAYAIVIQGGAIVAVVFVFWKRIVQVLQGLLGRDAAGRRLLISLVIGFLPAAVVGAVAEKKIKSVLFAPWPIVIAWVVGAGAILMLSRSGRLSPERRGFDLSELTYRHAAIIGAAQCLALWPGTSRSLATIVAACLLGSSLSAAVEFSFLLGLVTLSAATAYDAVKDGKHIVENYGVASPAIGFLCAAAAGFVAVKWMVTYLQKRDVAVFGWYRLAAAAGTVALIVGGRI